MNALPVVGGVLQDSSLRILLLHRTTPRPRWELPGGKLEKNETPEQAVVRELREELGVTVAVRNRLGDCTFTEDGRPFRYAWYAVQLVGGSPTPVEKAFDAVRYMSLDEAREHWADLSPNVRELLITCERDRDDTARAES
ncbi:NUDIX domain-containing protein [Streptomyces sp. NPDC059900]|uniref:NUDIX hydrolase n=1 Tax=Streptomyces sp. NPDC059900 TaxID=3155816 RepID=UPI0034214B83